VNSNFNYTLKDHSNLGVFYTYRGERQAIDLSTLDSYSLIDFRYAKSFYNDKITASVWLNNILDTEFIEITNFTTKGRNLRVGLAYKF